MKSNVTHKKTVLNFNANEWFVDRPAQPIRPVVTNQTTFSQQNNSNNVSVTQVNSPRTKDKNPVLIAVIVALVAILVAFAVIITSQSNGAAHIGMGQVMPIDYIKEQITGVLGNILI